MRDPWKIPASPGWYKELIEDSEKSVLPSIPTGPKQSLSGRMGQHYGTPMPNGMATGLRLYFLGLTDTANKQVFQLLPHVQSIESAKPFATFFQWTFGGRPMHQTSGRREEIITLRGRGAPVGLGHQNAIKDPENPLTVSDKYDGKKDKKSGLEQFEALHEFVTKYDDMARTRNIAMTLYMPWEGLAYYVEPESFTWGSSTSDTKFGFTWELTLKAYAYDAPTVEFVFSKETAELTALETFNDAMAKAAQFANDIKGFVDSFADYAERWMASVSGATAILSSYLGIVSESAVLRLPERAVGLARLTTSRVISDLDKLATCTPFVEKNNAFSRRMRDFRSMVTEKFDAATYIVAGIGEDSNSYKTLGKPLDANEIQRWQEEVESPEGYFSNVPSVAYGDQSSGGEPGIDPVVQTPFIPNLNIPVKGYVVKEGDTLESISLLNLGDPSDWTLIAALNGSYDGHGLWGNKPLTAGEQIIIPAGELPLNIGSGPDPFFTDFKIGDDGDFVLSGSETNDVLLVTGKSCLEQDLKHALITTKGQSVVFPNMGLTFGVGTPGTLNNISQIVFDIQTTMQQDPRVAFVKDTELIDGGDNLVINSVATAVNHETIAVIIPA